jgi:uncharacterized phage-associated protein
MVSVHDVAAAILSELGKPVSAMKLQKLAFYAKAWHAVWDDEELFPENFRAWVNGPVCYELYERHRGQFSVSDWPTGNASLLTNSETETVRSIVDSYGKLSAWELSNLTHSEAPWLDAREGCDPLERSNSEISLESMAEYYGSLTDSFDSVSR